ncbi:MAG TPA: hypothetical protein VFO41_06135, partial [Alphaproteobacteria bacterium]|nr:hypothetical protein [Alphaproteobacteria bacterium]
ALSDVAELRSPEYRYVSDFDCWLRLCLKGDFARIPHTLATWRLHDGAATVAASRRIMAREFIRVVAEFFKRGDLPEELRRYRSLAMSRAYCHAANLYWTAEPPIGALYNLLSHIRARQDPPELPPQLGRLGLKETIHRGAPWLRHLDPKKLLPPTSVRGTSADRSRKARGLSE